MILSPIQTCSIEEAGIALGLKPASVRSRIRSGELAAALVGRRWRVHLDSLNSLLAPVRRRPWPSQVTPVPAHSDSTSAPTSPPEPSPILAPPSVPEPLPADAPKPLFSDHDLTWIYRYRAELLDPSSDVRENARWQLSMFARSAGCHRIEHEAQKTPEITAYLDCLQDSLRSLPPLPLVPPPPPKPPPGPTQQLSLL